MLWDEIVRRFRVAVARSSFLKPLGRKNQLAPYIAAVNAKRRALDPAGNARRDAQRGLPEDRSENRGQWEHGAITQFQHQLDDMKRAVGTLIQDCDTRIKRLPPAPVLNSDQIVGEVDSKLSGLKERFKGILVEARTTMRQRRRDLVAFRDEHNLRREPSRYSPLITSMWIFAVFLSDVFLNYNMLWKLGAGSAVSVISVVIVPSVSSTMLGLAAGYFGIRHLLHKYPKQKLFGFFVLVFCVTAIVAIHATFADYRMALSDVNSTPGLSEVVRQERLNHAFRGIITNAFSSPFKFVQDFSAATYFLFGMMFSAVATIEGFFIIKDKYPGYYEASLEYIKARDKDVEARKGFERAANSAFALGENQAHAVRANGRTRMHAVKAILDEASEYERQYQAAATKVEQAIRQLVAEYRAVNKRVREGPGPGYFATDIPLLNRELPFTLEGMRRLEEVSINNQSALDTQTAQLVTKLTKAKSDYKTAVNAFLEEIERDAKAADIAEARIYRPREAAL